MFLYTAGLSGFGGGVGGVGRRRIEEGELRTGGEVERLSMGISCSVRNSMALLNNRLSGIGVGGRGFGSGFGGIVA